MAYGSVLTDTIQSSTAGTPPQFKDGNGTQIGTLCRAWVNFNGTGTVAIRASFNVSSITDTATGRYTVNFTNAMPDANYSCHGSHSNVSGDGSSTYFPGTNTTTSAPVTTTINAAYVDPTSVYIAFFR
jgi:hypothetical protein